MTGRPDRNIATLGTIVSSAPVAALREVLRQLRPQFETTLEEIPGGFGPAKRYRVTAELDDDAQTKQGLDPWLSIKSALMARFPADKPGAVTAIDP